MVRPPTLLAVTSPALPAKSPNAMDGTTFILQFLVAATDSNANIINYSNITISIYCDISYKVFIEVDLQRNQEGNPLELGPVTSL